MYHNNLFQGDLGPKETAVRNYYEITRDTAVRNYYVSPMVPHVTKSCRSFITYVYEEDYKEIQKLVQRFPNIQTGGDLFGLWKDEETVIIQQFIGPGKNCRRTTTSFYQDIEYLRMVGSGLTNEEGLCNVGEWHSHHQRGMPEPTDGDRTTVFSNMPQFGLERFVLFIASIESPGGKKRSHDVKLDYIKLRPFLFLGSPQKVVQGKMSNFPCYYPDMVVQKLV